MNIFKQYKDYLQDNPNGYWFKRKLYGWGWIPAKWQGWAVILLFLVIILLDSFSLGQNPTDSQVSWFMSTLILSMILLVYICYKKGETPKWQWGLKK